MNIKELINTLEKFSPYELLHNIPCSPHSYRGYYEQLAFERSGEDGTVGDFLILLDSCVGETFEGYKGGDFLMTLSSVVNIADYGNTGGEIEGVYIKDSGGGVVISAPYTIWS